MKKHIIPITLFLLFGSVIFINGLLPLISMILHLDFKFPTQYSYSIIIFSYLTVITTLLLEKDNLDTFNLDRASLLILVLVGLVRSNLLVPNETLYKIVIGIISSVLFLICIVEWEKIPKSSARWAILGVLVCVLTIPVALVEITQVEKYLVSNRMYEEKFIIYAIKNFMFQLSFIGPFEEITYRGILWGQLRKWNISENKIFWIQAISFWLMHFDQVFTISSLMILFLGLTFSLLARYSKQTFPSIIAHTLTNVLIPILVMVFTR